MSVKEIKENIGVIKANTAELGTKVDAVLAKLGETSGGASAAEIEEITAMVSGVRDDVQKIEDAVDAAVPPIPTPESGNR